ncbi:DUF6221 family protein [Amycolatopsis jejuensis]|uniref:DUF6221 family protein n=1 Tax=Amycolatopsis jejuensis TaxID=330084 RepID=UPI0005279657|nr:DUF6221 family protein [Amycolatopsis jejuensis]
MDDLIAFLRARLEEDEQHAQACCPVRWVSGPFGVQVDPTEIRDNKLAYGNLGYVAGSDPNELGFAYRAHIARHDPARVLAEVDAKRRIIELHTPRKRHDGDLECPTCVYTGEDEDAGGNRFRYVEHEDAPCETLLLLALPYAGHPDYREEWKP